ncbi:MAG TPA: 3-deoxy-manno-octulosonate cytidylyltransferase [Candidatus Gastranaerophilaceae bacterium]|nr:3-deoxy-manno-octulosonate cytidylyltransferase [Candidatus Gastranaerophilaceae bacterium]
MKIIGIIPARYQSSRFQGKPLADICGKPMIWWVYQQATKVKELQEVYVATDNKKIEEVCKKYKMNVIMTSSKHKTGTDRICEVAQKIKADLYLNIQGDEPLIEPETIQKAIEPFCKNPKLQISNLMTKINDPVDIANFTIPKVLVNNENIGIYLTRAAAPYPKGKIDFNYYKQVCVYGFKPKALEFFAKTKRGNLEEIEDIEILRFIENGYQVRFVEVVSDTIAVDTPNDLKKVIDFIKKKA